MGTSRCELRRRCEGKPGFPFENSGQLVSSKKAWRGGRKETQVKIAGICSRKPTVFPRNGSHTDSTLGRLRMSATQGTTIQYSSPDHET